MTATWRRWAARSDTLDHAIRRLRRSDDLERLTREVSRSSDDLERLTREVSELRQQQGNLASVERIYGPISRLLQAPPSMGRFLTFQPAGHFYSPVPDMGEVSRKAAQIFERDVELPGLALNQEAQRRLFSVLASLARELDLAAKPTDSSRYWLDNPMFGVGDALILAAMLRHLRPARYLEVGSGWSTALAMDINERWLDGSMTVTAIEPFPASLNRLLRPADEIELLPLSVQDVPLERFTKLEAGDVLFIDCSHVVKVGSDAHHLVTRVLPALPAGVIVHFHDIFWPFEYSRAWIEEGRAWSEAYLLHAFLLFNPAFEMLMFNDWLAFAERSLVERELPAMLANPGASLWLRRTGN
ncbi:MAG: class I SAM-dependent methyltransferase [Candidatus Dormibacteria bacterium]